MRPSINNILAKAFLLLIVTLSINSEDPNTMESKSIENQSADTVEGRVPVSLARELPTLSLRGKIRQSMAYNVVLINTRKGIVCSPLAALLTIGKVAMGSSSRRYQELKDAIGYSRPKLRYRFKTLMDNLAELKSRVQLILLSRLYVSKKDTLRSKFEEAVKYAFKSTVDMLDYENPKTAASAINNWVSSNSKGIINHIISSDDIKPTTSLLTINAICFKGSFKHSFDIVKTETFYATGGPKQVMMMMRQGYYNYIQSMLLKAQIIEIPYHGEDIRLIIVLPFDNNGLDSLLKNLAEVPSALNDVMKQMTRTALKLSIPKFKLATLIPMDGIFQKAGLNKIFESKNKVLTKVVRGSTVHLTRSVQKVVFELNERGTDSNVVADFHSILRVKDVPRNFISLEFKANYPFLFYVLVEDEQLFVGTYVGEEKGDSEEYYS